MVRVGGIVDFNAIVVDNEGIADEEVSKVLGESLIKTFGLEELKDIGIKRGAEIIELVLEGREITDVETETGVA